MGRKRLSEGEKKVAVKLSIRAKDIEELREQDVNISSLVQVMITDYLLKNDRKPL